MPRYALEVVSVYADAPVSWFNATVEKRGIGYSGTCTGFRANPLDWFEYTTCPDPRPECAGAYCPKRKHQRHAYAQWPTRQ